MIATKKLERPSSYRRANWLREEPVGGIALSRQQELGQFPTPAPLADFMASMFTADWPTVRLLDAGAGVGSLSVAFIRRLCAEKRKPKEIQVTAFEVDPSLMPALQANLDNCGRACGAVGIRFSAETHNEDFIEAASPQLCGDMFSPQPKRFNAAIINPPYRKIRSDSPHRLLLRSAGIETTNLYTGFLSLIVRLLDDGAQIVAITPRSFCNGPYFRPFREDVLSHLELQRLHVFESRQAAFRDNNVLQENIIFHAIKGQRQPRELVISSSSGQPGAAVTETIFPFAEIVHPRDTEKFIHIPSTSSHGEAKEIMDGLSSSLASLGVTVSTGRVVDFRLKNALRKEPERGSVPLLYPCHFNGGTVQWPKLEARKPNAILDNDETRPWLVPSGVYLLTKRFTSKEERRRLVACLFDPDQVKAKWIGFENHLNYFHADGHGLERTLAVGLFAFLNSTVVDQYFRRFSGHTQVNATDLRTLRYPHRKTLQAMGREMKTLDLSQDEIDQLVTKHLHACR